MTPCSQLPRNGLVERLAGLMYLSKGVSHLKSFTQDTRRTPGFCVICGAKLPVTWRGLKLIGPPDEQNPHGQFHCVESDHSPESLARVDEFNKKHPMDQWGLQNSYSLFPVTICDCVKADLWQDAQRLLKQQEATKPSARDAVYERRVKAAQRVAGKQ